MPFGAELLPAGGARFRLWAPAAGEVDLSLNGSFFRMKGAGDGWFELVHDQAKAGSRYCYRIDGRQEVPDPASRFQPKDAEGPSELIDPGGFDWQDAGWQGRPWPEAVIYELHVGTFSSQGGYSGVAAKLGHLKDLGVTAVELMPLADFCGRRNWGYDGVLPYAPDGRYGRPEALKGLVQAAHKAGLMVFLDVVYNHFGPKGNFLHLYAPQFFTEKHNTPWGAAIDFGLEPVRQYFIHNALYWLEEYRFDGLRLDAVDQIDDQSDEPILQEIAQAVRDHGFDRPVHLTTEDDRNVTRFQERGPDGSPKLYDGEWNDDWHHVAHVLATHESEGYYYDYAGAACRNMATALRDGYVYQGEHSPFRDHAERGEPS
ncbi:MAG TPA: alpha-amylase family glycosyl hydrolase, partial [Burkholderiales bacterium]